jgi:ubiquinol-cytochrome c reductase cytochrome b subunit
MKKLGLSKKNPALQEQNKNPKMDKILETIKNIGLRWNLENPKMKMNTRFFKILKEKIYINIINYPTPVNLNYLWNFGSILMLCLSIQLITGIMLAMWYIPECSQAFVSVEGTIMREVSFGWLMRYTHANGASFFFIALYIHMFRSLYYGSYTYPREKVWYSGCIIFLVLMATAFFGYILPWGQMSYWAATVITSLLSAIPYIGEFLLNFIWGGFSIEQPTLTRIFSLHFILPFAIVGLTIMHIFFLHEVGSNNPLGVQSYNNVSFFPYFLVKDILGAMCFLIIFIYIIFFEPNILLHPDNYIMANPEVTPAHIVPEWYFLIFYGILRSIPSKIGGIMTLILALICIFMLPIISKPLIKSGRFRPYFRILFWTFVADVIILSWTAANPVESPYYQMGQLATVYYFLFFLVLNPLLIRYEKESIGMEKLKKAKKKPSKDKYNFIGKLYSKKNIKKEN